MEDKRLLCNKCNKEFETNKIKVARRKGRVNVHKKSTEVNIVFFVCPHCKEEYVISVQTDNIESRVKTLIGSDVKLKQQYRQGFKDMAEYHAYMLEKEKWDKYRERLKTEMDKLKQSYLSTYDAKLGGEK